MAITKVTTDVITDLAVTAPKLAADSVITAKIADNAVTAAKIAAGALGDQVAGISSSASATTIAGTLTAGNTTISSNTIGNASASMILDSAGDIILDADGTQIILKDNGTEFAQFLTSSTPDHLYIRSMIQDKDIILSGNDNGSFISALTLDMSNAGTATFNNYVIAGATNDARVYFNASSGYSPRLQSSTNDLSIYTNNEARVTILNDGKVGIGTSPDTILHLKGGAPIFTIESNTNSSSRTWDFATERVEGGDLSLRVGTSLGGTPSLTSMYFKEDGKVGIGTTDPAQFLSVHGNVNFNTTNTDGNESRHLFVMGGSADPGTYSIYDAAENVKVKFNAGGDSYINGGSLHIGSTDSISSSAEIFSVYNAATGHSKMVNNSDSYGTLYMHNESTTANTFQPFIIMQKGGGNRGNIALRHTDSVLGISGQGGISLRTSSTSVQAATEIVLITSGGYREGAEVKGQLTGGFGAMTTSGNTDYNDSTNARSGMGYTLLLGTASNGPGGSGAYFHVVNFEYTAKDGTGNMTQLALPYYGSSSIYIRQRYQGSWSSWGTV